MGMTKEEFLRRYFRDMERKRREEEERRKDQERLLNGYEIDRLRKVERSLRNHTIKGHN